MVVHVPVRLTWHRHVATWFLSVATDVRWFMTEHMIHIMLPIVSDNPPKWTIPWATPKKNQNSGRLLVIIRTKAPEVGPNFISKTKVSPYIDCLFYEWKKKHYQLDWWQILKSIEIVNDSKDEMKY